MGLEKGAEPPLGCPASSMHFLEGGIFFGFAAEIEEMTMFEPALGLFCDLRLSLIYTTLQTTCRAHLGSSEPVVYACPALALVFITRSSGAMKQKTL